jgi:phage protein D
MSGAQSGAATFRTLQDRYEDFYVPQFTVTVGGTDFSETDGVVSDVSVDLTLDKASKFSFTLNYPYNTEQGQFEGLDWDLFAPDQSVRVEMGYGDTEAPLLHEGRVTAVRPSFPSGGAPTVTVDGFGLLHTMTEPPEPEGDRESWTHTWTKTAPHEVVERVVAERGYDFGSVETVDGGVEPAEIKQADSDHDLAFLLKLGDAYAYELYAWDGDLYFRPPRYDGPAELTLEYGSSLDSFSPEVNEAGQVDRVEVRNWSAERGEEIVGTATRDAIGGASAGSGEPTTETLRLPVRTTAEATARAEAVLANRLDGTVSGKGECIGLPEIRPGIRIRLDGLTDQFSTVYYVESATHRFGDSGYRTSFSVKRREL